MRDLAYGCRQPGCWSVWRGQVWVICPKCGESAALHHDIADDGTVRPSLVCPFDGCGYHEYIRLLDWDPTLEPPTEGEDDG
jgi:hypothetical protein